MPEVYACVYAPPLPVSEHRTGAPPGVLVALAQAFSPRYQRQSDSLVLIDVSGLGRLLGSPRAIGEELRREAVARGVRAHVAIAGTYTAALVLASQRPGLVVVEPGQESSSLASLPFRALEILVSDTVSDTRPVPDYGFGLEAEAAFTRWGIRTLGDVARLPPAELAARFGHTRAVNCQAFARGEDVRPFVPDAPEERFQASLDLEWPIDGLEPLSFVLTRLLEPLSTRLEQRDRGAARLYLELTLVSGDMHARQLHLPSPMRDVRTLRTLALLDLESHPPPAAIDRVAVIIDPTPARVLQHTLFTRASAMPEQISTLLARLGAVMGQDRIGAPETIDSYRPGAFAMAPFAADRDEPRRGRGVRSAPATNTPNVSNVPNAPKAPNVLDARHPLSALRRCRRPIPARVRVGAGRPVRVTTDRQGFAGGAVVSAVGPWRTSGAWWAGGAGQAGRVEEPVAPAGTVPPHQPIPPNPPVPPVLPSWDRDEWDVALGDGAVYRIFQDRGTEAWFIDAIVD